MLKKRSKFWTVVFSFLPGAGHMFMGFMKRGISLMALFFLTIFLSSWLDIGPLMYVLPVLWFYAFFDCINRAWADDREFATLDDRFLFSKETLERANRMLSGRGMLYAGILLLLFGIYLIVDKLLTACQSVLNPILASVISGTVSVIPQFLLGVLVILVGVRLIVGKKKELDEND